LKQAYRKFYISSTPATTHHETSQQLLPFADDTAVLTTRKEPPLASMKLQATINKIDDWVKKWKI
jgi:hypothetical protein